MIGEADGALLVPEGYEVADLEAYHAQPRRATENRSFQALTSFLAYFDRFKNDASTIFVDRSKKKVGAVIDYHSDEPAWGDHQASYTMPISREWKAWTEANQRKMNQREFASFIEDSMLDIRAPEGAAILEMVRNLQATKNVKFVSDVRDNAAGDVRFMFETETNAKGEIDIPEVFGLLLPVLEGGDLFEVDARFRYNISDGGSLTMWYDLLRPHKVEEAAVDNTIVQIREHAEHVYMAQL